MTHRYQITLDEQELSDIAMALGSLAEHWTDLADEEKDREEHMELRSNAIDIGHLFDKIAELRDMEGEGLSEVRCYPVFRESKK